MRNHHPSISNLFIYFTDGRPNIKGNFILHINDLDVPNILRIHII
jgi:hypothetical protein